MTRRSGHHRGREREEPTLAPMSSTTRESGSRRTNKSSVSGSLASLPRQ
jgi:hypothetical protein